MNRRSLLRGRGTTVVHVFVYNDSHISLNCINVLSDNIDLRLINFRQKIVMLVGVREILRLGLCFYREYEDNVTGSRYIYTHFYCLAVDAVFYSNEVHVECLPVDPATWVRFPAGSGKTFLLYDNGPLLIELKFLLKLLRNRCARTFTLERLQLQPLVGWQINKNNSPVCFTSNLHHKQTAQPILIINYV